MDSHGAVRSWRVWTIKPDYNYLARTEFGMVGGTQQTATKSCLIGDEPIEAIHDAQKFIVSMWERQKKKGYTENKNGEPEGDAPLPMLAKLFENEKHKITYPVAVQPKLDGFRCIAIKKDGIVSCWSRRGLRFETTGAIEADLNEQMLEGDVYDGELYKHNTDFNLLSGEIRNASKNKSTAQYHIYDFIHKEKLQAVRLGKINDLKETENIKVVHTVIANSEQEVYAITDEYIAQGYEGGIVRNVFGRYRSKYRSSELLKVKNFLEDDFYIVDFHEGEGKEEGLIIWDLITEDGKEFSARPRGTYDQRQELFANGYNHLGKYLTVRYFNKSADGIPRFPVGLRIKERLE